MNSDDETGYLAEGPFTRAGGRERILDAIIEEVGTAPSALAGRIRALMVHAFWQGAYGIKEDEARTIRETGARGMAERLELIAARQKAFGRPEDSVEPLPPERRTVGNCRDYSLFLAALLKRAGTPARARCGFGMYFMPKRGEDHWVVERWDSSASRWTVCDPQLDGLMTEKLRIEFDPMDMPDGAFLSGGEAWLACRAGDDPDKYGIFEFKGWDFIKGDFVRDLNALAGLELLPWDCWAIIEKPYAGLDPADLAALDAAARSTPMRSRITRTEAAELCSDARFALPRSITSYPKGGSAVTADIGAFLDRRA